MIRPAEQIEVLRTASTAAEIALRVRDVFIKRTTQKLNSILYKKQAERLEEKLTEVLEPLLVKQVEEMANRLRSASGKKPKKLVKQILDLDKQKEELVDVMFPVLAAEMLEAMRMEYDQITADTAKFRR